MRILLLLITTLGLSCTSKKEDKSTSNNYPIFSCKFIETYDNPKTKLNERIFEFSVLNNSLDTIFINVADSGIEPHRWIYTFEFEGNIRLDSMDFESHFNKIEYPIAPQVHYKFIDTIHSPFKTISNDFVFRYVLKGKFYKIKAICD